MDLIINHPSFDKAKSQLIKSIFTAVEKWHFEIFKKLIKINDDDVNICDSNRKILLNFAVVNNRVEIVDYILDNQNFDPIICDIFAAFTFYIENVTEESFYMMTKLYKYDKIKDTQNRIFENMFKECLKDSKAVKKTYLHIAARSRILDILKLLVEIDGIDINSKDELGETPLFDACRFSRFENIEYLASLKNVDFDCCNCDGDDVLKVSIKLMDKNPDFEIKNREDYAKALSLIFKRNQDYFYFDDVD